VLKGDCVAIDSSKFKAVNNRDHNFTKNKIASGPDGTDQCSRPSGHCRLSQTLT